jgi:hypothetical protein
MEKRDTGRNRVLKSGAIEFNGGAIDCVVRNISETGAALDVASPVGIPEHFILAILPDGSRHRCRIAWRKDRRIGVAFSKA